ncbi:hypothetical protein [Filifactor alocis]|uniref:hypothetical protein n=1 Tax=Filifactor alocis TaxID=143361 RepID=UPI003FA0C3AD
MELKIDQLYEIKRKNADASSKQNEKDRMIFLGTLGSGNSEMLLFRHPKGYKETFLKSSIGNDVEITEVNR